MTRLASCSPMHDLICAAIRGIPAAWSGSGVAPDAFRAACEAHGVSAVLAQRVRNGNVGGDWPLAVRVELLRDARAAAAAELSVAADLAVALEALADAGLRPIVFKGTALAYSVYPAPELRPRGDCDVLIREPDYRAARRVLESLGYTAAVTCERVHGQVRFDKITTVGVAHAIDLHWRISTQTAFANLVQYDELSAHSVALPLLSSRARAAGPAHALLLACVHPVMHHRNQELLIWVYDIHVLAALMSADDWERYIALALDRGVAAICADQLARAVTRFGTVVPGGVIGRLERRRAREASAVYLGDGRQWRHELRDNLRHAPSWTARARLLREVLFPDRDYMRQRYRVPSAVVLALLPALHAYRLTRGALVTLLGRK